MLGSPKGSARRVSDLRASLGLTQDEFARLFGVAVVTVIRWETARNTPKGSNTILISALDLASQEDPLLGRRISDDLRDHSGLVTIWAHVFALTGLPSRKN